MGLAQWQLWLLGPSRAPRVFSLPVSLEGLPEGRAAHIGEPLPEHTVSRKRGDQRGHMLAGEILFPAFGKNRSAWLGPGGRPGHNKAALSPSRRGLWLTPRASSPGSLVRPACTVRGHGRSGGPNARGGGGQGTASVLLLPLPGPSLVSPTGGRGCLSAGT